jgi:hypothetical protein
MPLERVPFIRFGDDSFSGIIRSTGKRDLDTAVDADLDAPDLLATGLDTPDYTVDVALGEFGRTTIASGALGEGGATGFLVRFLPISQIPERMEAEPSDVGIDGYALEVGGGGGHVRFKLYRSATSDSR